MEQKNIYNLTGEDKNSVKLTVNSKGRYSGAEVKVYNENIDTAKEMTKKIASELKKLIEDQK